MTRNFQLDIQNRIHESLSPTHLDIVNESRMHGGSAETQSHFKIVVVSESFQGQKLLARHRQVQHLLSDIISQVRAISLHTLTPDEWQKAEENNTQFRSPGCHNRE